MTSPAISIDQLSKSYTIRHLHGSGNELRHRVHDLALAPFRTIRRMLGPEPPPQVTPQSEGTPATEVFWALRDVSFDIARGDVVGIIGRNGAGKSTLLKVVSRITEPTSGSVRIRGRCASLLEIGTGFHPELTGRENIFVNGAILGMSRREIQARFDEIVAFAEVERFLDTPVKRYSSGMHVRLAFAVAAHLEPEILVVDEVLAVGDAEFQRKCLGKMSDVARGGRTVLFVSHQLSAIRALCTSAVMLSRGRLAAIGSVDHVLETYLGSFQQRGRSDGAPMGRFLKNAFFVSGGEIEGTRHSVGIGESTTIRVLFDLPRPSRFPVVGIVAHRADTGETVFGSNTRVAGQPQLTAPATSASIDVVLDPLNLVQGQYRLDVWVGCDNDDLERVEGVLELEIVDHNVHGTGKAPFTQFGSCFVPMTFRESAPTAVATDRVEVG